MNSDNDSRPLYAHPLVRLIVGGVVGLFLMIYLLAGITSIDPGEVGVLIKNLGAGKGMQKEVLGTGMHWIEPFVYDVAVYNTRARQMEEVEGLPANTGDGQPVKVDFSLQLSLDPLLVPKLHQNIGPNYYDNVVHPALIKIVKDKVPSEASDIVYTTKGRELIESAINRALSERFAPDGILPEINLKDVPFQNPDYVKILEAKAKATQQVEVETRNAQAAVQTAIKMANLAEGQKQATIKAAEAQREQARLEGEGSRLKQEETAKGNLAVLLAEAQGTAAKRNALEGAGGDRLVQIAWAENLGPNVKVWGVPTGAPGTSTIVDLNAILKGAFKGE